MRPTSLQRCLTTKYCIRLAPCRFLFAADLEGGHSNVLPMCRHFRLVFLKLLYDSSHLLSHVDVPVNVIFEDKGACNFLVNNPGKPRLAINKRPIKEASCGLPLHNIHMCAPAPDKAGPTHVRFGNLLNGMLNQYRTTPGISCACM